MDWLKQEADNIQAEANSKIEKLFQKEFEEVFEELCKLYPKRNIEIIFGNGSMCVTGFESTKYLLGFSDMYGNLQTYNECINLGTLDKFPEDHPLIRLMKIMDVCYYPNNGSGWCLALNDLKKL